MQARKGEFLMENKKLGALAFLPLIVFLGTYIGCGIVFSVMGAESPFGYFPRHVALLVGIASALILAPGVKISEKVDVLTENMGRSGVMMIVLIYLMASGFQGAAAAIGGKTSVINLSLHYIPVKLLVPGVFMMCCFISTAIGTSMGTMAAMAPVALGVAEGAGLNAAIVCAAVIGGSYFGDNLSMISDTTIAAAEGCGSEMRDKFRMNFFIAFPAAVLSLIFYGFIGGAGSGSIEVGAFDLFQIAPYIVVLVTALMGINVAVVLFIGILMTFIVGLLQGNVGFFDIAMAVGDGMADMFSISIVAILVSGVIGLVRYYGGIEWMIDTITKKIKNRKQAEYGIGILSGILSGAMVNNTIAIIVTCPIAKEIGSKYKIAPKRLASLVDIFACAFLAVMPHDGGMLMTSEMANISPFAILPYSVYPLFLIIATCITIQAGLLRTAEEKQKK